VRDIRKRRAPAVLDPPEATATQESGSKEVTANIPYKKGTCTDSVLGQNTAKWNLLSPIERGGNMLEDS
jgi:hypothetical protein